VPCMGQLASRAAKVILHDKPHGLLIDDKHLGELLGYPECLKGADSAWRQVDGDRSQSPGEIARLPAPLPRALVSTADQRVQRSKASQLSRR